VVGRALRVELYGVFDILDFLGVVPHLSDGLALQMPELALFVQVETDVATTYNLLPSLKPHVSVGFYQVGLLIVLESIGQLQYAFIVLLLL